MTIKNRMKKKNQTRIAKIKKIYKKIQKQDIQTKKKKIKVGKEVGQKIKRNT